MTIRVFDFADGFTSASAPTEDAIETASLPQYASDAAYVSDNGTASDGNIYYNTTDDKVRVYANGAWVEVASFEP